MGQVCPTIMQCPLCHALLPDDSTACTACDWIRQSDEPNDDFRNRVAALISVVPGLGHLYKGHLILGGFVFFVIGPLLLALCLFLAAGTLGLSVLVLPVFVAGVMFHAYHAVDRRSDVIRAAQEMNRG